MNIRSRNGFGRDPGACDHERMRTRNVVAALVAIVLVAVVAPAASAHTSLVSSSPAPGAVIESPASVSLTFDDALLQLGDSVQVRDADGVNHAGDPYFPRDNTIQADVDGTLAPGDYVVAWRIVAEDGHPIQGTIPFTVVGDASAITAPSPSSPPPAAAASSAFPWLLAAGVLGALVLIGLVVFVAVPRDPETRSRRRRSRG